MSEPERTGHIITSRVGLPTDEDGFFGRECPDKTCLAYFKLHIDEYQLAKDAGVLTCPVCGTRQDHEKFMTPEQVRRTDAAIREFAQSTAEALLRDAFKGFKTKPGSGVSFRYRPAPPRTPRPLPTYVERASIRTFACPVGGHRAVLYDRLAACPYCGPDTPLRAILEDALAIQRRLLEAIDHMPEEYRAEVQALGGEPAMAERSLAGAVAALQSFAKDFHNESGKATTVNNPWQSPVRLRQQWQSSFGQDPFAGIPPDQERTIHLGFARRHILEHNGGKADERYLRESGDTIARGRPVRYDAGFVRDFIDASVALADGLAKQ